MATSDDVKIEGGEMAVAATPVDASAKPETGMDQVDTIVGGGAIVVEAGKKRSPRRRSNLKRCPLGKKRSRKGNCVKKTSRALSIKRRSCKSGKTKKMRKGKLRCVVSRRK
jgi:hypothetical protein